MTGVPIEISGNTDLKGWSLRYIIPTHVFLRDTDSLAALAEKLI